MDRRGYFVYLVGKRTRPACFWASRECGERSASTDH